ncbi:MAG: DinB family protein [bacterium]
MRAFVGVCEQIPDDRWREPTAAGKWTPAQVVLHLCIAYELGITAAAGGAGMRMRVSPLRAWALRTFLFPILVAAKRFPHGVPAPAEVRPDAGIAEGLTREDAMSRLERAARGAAAALLRADEERPVPRFAHAYFGALAPLASLRLLTAHTSHHTRGLSRAMMETAVGR